ncbi:peptidoglycan bridge formation glycyltransferase FemA/FemB family protein [Candidatus Saccharibacteria bacterium]|nr:peptidoglycan bridge formation glycyltransferase FemA/FemB family protein [Candidatus Saccharibacteria bacterium]
MNSLASAEEWQKVVKKHPEANFLQSPTYGKMHTIIGEKVILEDFDGGGWALMIIHDAKRGRYMEIPCGPLLDWGDLKQTKKIFGLIRDIAKKEHCVFVRVRPQLPATSDNLQLLASLDLKKAPMHLAAEHTVMIDLTKTEEELLAAMRRQTRYEVRRADKLGIRVSRDDSKDCFREFHSIQVETAKRQGFVPPSLNTLFAEREAFLGSAWIYKATTDIDGVQKPMAYGLIIGDGLEADYYEAASTDLNRKLPGAYALLWQAMRDLKKAGYQRFNLWGIAPAGQPNHRYAGVTTFKTGFGGEVVEYVPAHDMVISRMRYLKDLVVEKARKKRRHL